MTMIAGTKCRFWALIPPPPPHRPRLEANLALPHAYQRNHHRGHAQAGPDVGPEVRHLVAREPVQGREGRHVHLDQAQTLQATLHRRTEGDLTWGNTGVRLDTLSVVTCPSS
jgi:hypothetical protein